MKKKIIVIVRDKPLSDTKKSHLPLSHDGKISSTEHIRLGYFRSMGITSNSAGPISEMWP